MYLQINELVKPKKNHIKQKCSILPDVISGIYTPPDTGLRQKDSKVNIGYIARSHLKAKEKVYSKSIKFLCFFFHTF